MALTPVGFQGTITDYAMATQLGAHHLPTVRSATDLQVSAVAGQRTVHAAAGTADSGFIKVTSDGAAAADLALAPPASGGKWYAVCLNRQWSPTNTATWAADDLAVSDTNGTIPTVVPPAVVSAVAALPNQPGTAGSAAGQRQLLALVYVRAADTTLTIFDMRFRRTGAGPVLAPNFWALIIATAWGLLLEGALVSIARHTMASGGIHARSTWELLGIGYWSAVGRIVVDDRTAAKPTSTTQPQVTDGNNTYVDAGHSRADLLTIASFNNAAAGTITLEPGVELFDVGSQVSFRWQTPLGTTRFYPWDSPWVGIPVTAYDTGSGSTFPIYLYQAQIRFRAGKSCFRGSLVLNAAASFSYLKLGWPGQLPKIDAGSNQGGSQMVTNDVHYQDASDGYRRYRGECWADTQTTIRFYTPNPGDTGRPGIQVDIATSNVFNAQWAQSDTITWSVEAELAL